MVVRAVVDRIGRNQRGDDDRRNARPVLFERESVFVRRRKLGSISGSDGGGRYPVATRPVEGAERVARFYIGIFQGRQLDASTVTVEPVLVNGEPGFLVRGKWADGRPLLSVVGVAVSGGRITGIFNQMNPDKILLSDLL